MIYIQEACLRKSCNFASLISDLHSLAIFPSMRVSNKVFGGSYFSYPMRKIDNIMNVYIFQELRGIQEWQLMFPVHIIISEWCFPSHTIYVILILRELKVCRVGISYYRNSNFFPFFSCLHFTRFWGNCLFSP